MPRRALRLMVATLLAVGLVPAVMPTVARSQEEGVTLDPGDPAAKEYSLPTAEARREAGGGGNAPTPQGSAEAAPFGAGVSRDASPSGPSKSQTGRGSTAEPDGPTRAERGEADQSPSTPGAPTERATSAEGMSSTTALIGGGLLALLAAGLGGLALRATRGPDAGA